MDLFEQINTDIKAAMLAHETVRLAALRGVKKEFLEAKTSKNANGELTDETAVKILQKMVKQRKESAAIFTEQNRADLAENELAEAGFIEAYLPKQLSAEEIEAEVRKIMEQTGASSMKDMGKVMGAASKALAGKADGKVISDIVKKLLA
ncbi:MAG: GatB/YqeY domain-containing protein [Bacteroides sp.]|nr:GatB/YqeY domain-containing protein [Bacteroides sp.]MCM1084734.1 GatB/YqeY domain-containing protein [Bacteroides sp.]MCM1531081.1 GatB/YqeY domain-containing protein [Ruminococcus flavefaciens]MCM1554930.1 GatB/YqeY domain-containing protein [Bacteroides sp.]